MIPTLTDIAQHRIEHTNLEAIASALSILARFSGSGAPRYTAAQHNLMASLIVPCEFARDALLSGVAAVLTADLKIPRSIRRPGHALDAESLSRALSERFNLDGTPDATRAIRMADLVLLATELRDFFGSLGCDNACASISGIRPLPTRITVMRPATARHAFLERAEELGIRR